MVPKLEINISKILSKFDDSVLLKDINFSQNGPGIVWILGENGTGKSLLASVISGKAFFAESRLKAEGRVELHTKEGNLYSATKERGAKDYSKNISYWPQRVGESLISIHHQDDLCSGFEARLNRNRKNLERFIPQLQQLIEEFNLVQHLAKVNGTSSYGETRRIELAVNLTSESPVIVADEPFSGLDPYWKKVFVRIVDLYLKLFGCIWVITSHLPPESYGITASQTIKLNFDDNNLEIYKEIKNESVKIIQSSRIEKDYSISIRQLTIVRKHKMGKSIVRLRNFEAQSGSVSCLWGKNGAGKTTIGHLLAGIIRKSNFSRKIMTYGSIDGEPYNGSFIKAPNDEIRILLQNPFISFIRENVREDLLHPQCPGNFRTSTSSVSSGFLKLLESFWGDLNRDGYSFSFGQLRFLQFLLLPPTVGIIIFDEPFLGVHPVLHSIIANFLREIANTGRTVIFTSEHKDESDSVDKSFFLMSVN